MLKYCRSDVDILRRCCKIFREQFQSVTGVDPFTYVTIASACMAVYRSGHIKPKTIAMIPVQGYCNSINFSRDSIRWLDFVAHTEGHRILHPSEWDSHTEEERSITGTWVTEEVKKAREKGIQIVKIKDVFLPTPEIAAFQWTQSNDFVTQDSSTNIFIAAFTTCHARLKLYSEIEKLNESVLYFDTDSNYLQK
ncbi:uncharacterized protein TNCV_1035861 [Trichonephila clavipes]|nr:uncharacterized protein TNCV_1035861 [Trichonephila clavipes]